MIENVTGKILVLFMIMIFLISFPVLAVEVTDLAGRKVEVPENIERIVAVGPGSLRLVVYLEAENMVAGIEEFENRNKMRPYILAKPELSDLTIIGPQFGGDPELIASVDPDIIIKSYTPPSEADKLSKKTGIPVVMINDGEAGSMEEKEMLKAVDFLGSILDKQKRAEEIKEKYQYYINDLQKRAEISDSEIKDELYIGGIGFKGAKGITSTETDYIPFKYLDIKNPASEKYSGNIMVSREQLLIWNPPIIFVDQGGINLVKKDFKRAEFKYLDALKNDNIYGLLPYNHYTTNFATMLADAYYIAKIIYPEQFKDIDPISKADEIYKFFVGKEVYSDMSKIFGGFKKLKFE